MNVATATRKAHTSTKPHKLGERGHSSVQITSLSKLAKLRKERNLVIFLADAEKEIVVCNHGCRIGGKISHSECDVYKISDSGS